MDELGDILRVRLKKRKLLKLKVGKPIGKAYTEEEKVRMLEVAKSARSPHIYPAIMLALNAGIRDAELKQLTWGQINLKRSYLTVGESKTEAGEGRTIPLNSSLAKTMNEYAEWYKERFAATEPGWYVFPFGKPRPSDPTKPVTTLKTAWNNVRKKAKVTGRWHDHRHTMITDLAESGAGDQTIMEALSTCARNLKHWCMKNDRSRYSGYRFPSQIISYAVWAYHRFCLSFRDVEELLAERGIIVSYETIRQWCEKFGLDYALRLKRREGRLGDHWHLDEVFIRINGQQRYLWRAVDQDGDVIDILVQPHRDQRAAERFLRKLLRGQGSEPLQIITDKLRSYSAAMRSIFSNVTHRVERYANNRVEASHQPTRQRERQMRRFKSARHAQRFLSLHDAVRNLFRVGRHLLRSSNHRLLRSRSFAVWREVTAA